MSVSSTLTALESQVATVLGSGWSELEYIYDLERNNGKRLNQKYGIGVASGDSVSGVNKAITYDFNFFVVLTKSYVNKSSDEAERVVISALYDQAKNIDINIFQKKLGIPNSVLLVSGISYEQPEVLEKGAIALRVNFVIKFREAT